MAGISYLAILFIILIVNLFDICIGFEVVFTCIVLVLFRFDISNITFYKLYSNVLQYISRVGQAFLGLESIGGEKGREVVEYTKCAIAGTQRISTWLAQICLYQFQGFQPLFFVFLSDSLILSELSV